MIITIDTAPLEVLYTIVNSRAREDYDCWPRDCGHTSTPNAESALQLRHLEDTLRALSDQLPPDQRTEFVSKIGLGRRLGPPRSRGIDDSVRVRAHVPVKLAAPPEAVADDLRDHD